MTELILLLITAIALIAAYHWGKYEAVECNKCGFDDGFWHGYDEGYQDRVNGKAARIYDRERQGSRGRQ